MKTPAKAAPQTRAAIERQVESCIDKFDPQNAALIRAVRQTLRLRMPTAHELVYDNYNFFVIGYCSTERPSDCIVSIAAAASGVGLSFYYGADFARSAWPVAGQWQPEPLHPPGIAGCSGAP